MSINQNKQTIKGHLLGFLANFIWGLMAPVGKEALRSFDPFLLTFFRMLGAGICFWIVSLFIARDERVEKRDLLRIMIASFFALSINQGLYIYGLSLTSPISATIVTTLLPVLTMIFASLFLGEPMSGKKVWGVIIGLSGAVTLILGQAGGLGGGSLLGNILCLSSPICFAIYLTAFKDLSAKYSAFTLNKWMFMTASLVYLPLSAPHLMDLPHVSIPASAVYSTLYVVFGGSFIAYLCLMTAQRFLRPTVLSMYNYTAPIVATIAALILGNGSLSALMLGSMAMIFLGVYLVTISRAKGTK